MAESEDPVTVRTALTKLLADLDYLFAIRASEQDKSSRAWVLNFELENDLPVRIQLGVTEGWVPVLYYVEFVGEPPVEVLRKFLELNALIPNTTISIVGNGVGIASSVSVLHLDAEGLKNAIGSVLTLVTEARKAMRAASLEFRDPLP